MDENVFIARQPILDRDESLFAYELLFRKKQTDANASVLNDVEATAQVLDNALNNVGTAKLVGNHLAFINCSYEFLTSEILFMLDSKIFVLEILETVEIDDKIVEAVKNFHSLGYKIAIDDFIPTCEKLNRILPLLPYINVVKLEFPALANSDIKKTVKIFHDRNIKVLAEKIETQENFRECYDAGCDFFQGYFFAKPENFSANKLNTNIIEVFELMKSIDKRLDFTHLEAQFKRHPELLVNLIKYLNSASFGLRSKITSIKHAITLLGYDNLKRWLLILAYAGGNEAKINSHSPLLVNAIHRAKFFEELSKFLKLSENVTEKAYLMGLISHLDMIYKVPIQSVLEQMNLDTEINQAIINKDGTLGELFTLLQAIEADDLDRIELSLTHLSLSTENINAALLKAYEASNNI
jgi:EAL and modified HD-GYP domain-containing signal transduction protein